MLLHAAWISFLLAFTTLLPLINPIGSALIFLGMVGEAPEAVYWQLARKIALITIVFLVVIEFLGSLILSFFGISLPVVQVTGGIIIAATAWSLLFESDANAPARKKHEEIGNNDTTTESSLSDKIFYPFTFPITAGPGSLVVMLTLSAHVSNKGLVETASGHAGIVLAVILICASVYLCYGYAPRLTQKIKPSTVHGILRVIAFILMCIGVQIAWNGATMLAEVLLGHH